jgi:hypothetical protein
MRDKMARSWNGCDIKEMGQLPSRVAFLSTSRRVLGVVDGILEKSWYCSVSGTAWENLMIEAPRYPDF